MSSSSNSSSSLSGSTSNAPGSGRIFTGQFGSMSPVFNPDGTIKGIYDLQGNLLVSNSNVTRVGPRNSAVISSPAMVNASSSRAPPPSSSMRNSGVSVSRALNSDRGILESPRIRILQRQGPPQVSSVRGSSYLTAGRHSQTHVQPMSSQSPVNSMNDMNTSPSQLGSNAGHQVEPRQKEVMMQSQQSSMGRHGGVYLGGASASHYPPQPQRAQAVSSGGISTQTSGLRPVSAAMGYDQPLQHHQSTSPYRGSAIGQPIRDVGSETRQATPESNPDPFSMLGLVSVLNQTNPDATTLALGLDLQTMGLDMTSKEDLFNTFASPWDTEPLKDGDLEFTLPQCYNVKQEVPPLHMQQGMFRTFKPEALFYIFYSMPKDEAQLYAANELYNRGWFYHKEYKCWFLQIGQNLAKTNEYEIGTYHCFDPDKFISVRKENVFIDYEMLERRPSLPQYRV